MKLYQITEDDLGALEREIPKIVDALYSTMDNRLRVKIRKVQQVLSDVRWNYGPPSQVTNIPVDGGGKP